MEVPAQAALEIITKFLGIHKIKNLNHGWHFLSISIYSDDVGTGINIFQKLSMSYIFRQFRMNDPQGVLIPIQSNGNCHVAQDHREMDFEDITDTQAAVISLTTTEHADRLDIANAVATIAHYTM